MWLLEAPAEVVAVVTVMTVVLLVMLRLLENTAPGVLETLVMFAVMFLLVVEVEGQLFGLIVMMLFEVHSGVEEVSYLLLGALV